MPHPDAYKHATIYADGHSVSVSATEAAKLEHLGLVEPHPGIGEDGIEVGDLILSATAEWRNVSDALADIHHAE